MGRPGMRMLNSKLQFNSEATACFKKAASCPVTTIGEIVADKTGEITLVDKKRTIVGYNRY